MPRYDCFQNGRHPYGICSDFIGYVEAPSLADAYDAAHRYLANSGYLAVVVNEV